LLAQGDTLFDGFLFPVQCFAGLRFGGLFDQTRQGLAREPALVFEVALGDGLPLGVPGQPRPTPPQELLYLIVPHPVVFVVVEHRNQHVQVRE
jgi:hypothetical protein